MANDSLLQILTSIEPGIDYINQKGLVTNHILTSLDIVRLVMEISNQYDIKISPIDVIPENFDSLDKIDELINKYLEQQ
jgi:acyl carrier protein